LGAPRKSNTYGNAQLAGTPRSTGFDETVDLYPDWAAVSAALTKPA
jgi:hypothetical protein